MKSFKFKMTINLRVLFAVIGFQSIFSSVFSEKANYSRWVFTSHFTSEELARLNRQQEHELLLKRFAQKDPIFLAVAFTVEIFANGIGNDFFEFTSDEKASIENKAIVMAAFHCFTKLRFQVRVTRSTERAARKAFDFLKETGNL